MVAGMVDIEPIRRALDKEKAQTLPILHAFTGADKVLRNKQNTMVSAIHES